MKKSIVVLGNHHVTGFWAVPALILGVILGLAILALVVPLTLGVTAVALVAALGAVAFALVVAAIAIIGALAFLRFGHFKHVIIRFRRDGHKQSCPLNVDLRGRDAWNTMRAYYDDNRERHSWSHAVNHAAKLYFTRDLKAILTLAIAEQYGDDMAADFSSVKGNYELNIH